MALPPPQLLGQPWTCSACLFDNWVDVKICDMCDTPSSVENLDVPMEGVVEESASVARSLNKRAHRGTEAKQGRPFKSVVSCASVKRTLKNQRRRLEAKAAKAADDKRKVEQQLEEQTSLACAEKVVMEQRLAEEKKKAREQIAEEKKRAREQSSQIACQKDALMQAGKRMITLQGMTPSFCSLSQKLPEYEAVVDWVTKAVERHRKSLHSDEFCDPPQLKVVAVKSIVSEHNLTAYWECRKHMMQKYGKRCEPLLLKQPALGVKADGHINEFFLFHGCPGDVVDKVYRSGLDPQRGGEGAGAMFGVGTYLADLASKSDRYAQPDQHGNRTLLIVRVALGRSAYMLQPTNAHRAPDGFDSACALTRAEFGSVDHREYIVYKGQQMLPVFAVKYKHLKRCRCASCLA